MIINGIRINRILLQYIDDEINTKKIDKMDVQSTFDSINISEIGNSSMDQIEKLLSRKDTYLEISTDVTKTFAGCSYFYGVFIEIDKDGEKFIEIYQQKEHDEIREYIKKYSTVKFVFYDRDTPIISGPLHEEMFDSLKNFIPTLKSPVYCGEQFRIENEERGKIGGIGYFTSFKNNKYLVTAGHVLNVENAKTASFDNGEVQNSIKTYYEPSSFDIGALELDVGHSNQISFSPNLQIPTQVTDDYGIFTVDQFLSLIFEQKEKTPVYLISSKEKKIMHPLIN